MKMGGSEQNRPVLFGLVLAQTRIESSVFRGAALGGLIHIHDPADYRRDLVGRDMPQAGQRSQDRMPMQDGRPGRRDAAGLPHGLPRQEPSSCRAVKGSFPGCFSHGTVQ